MLNFRYLTRHVCLLSKSRIFDGSTPRFNQIFGDYDLCFALVSSLPDSVARACIKS